jgi:hypothetical protein
MRLTLIRGRRDRSSALACWPLDIASPMPTVKFDVHRLDIAKLRRKAPPVRKADHPTVCNLKLPIRQLPTLDNHGAVMVARSPWNDSVDPRDTPIQ